MICPNCGKEIADNTAFCKECGASLQAAAPMQPAVPVPPPVQPVPQMPYGAPVQAPVQQKNTLVIAIIMLLFIGFLAQGLFTGTVFKFIGEPKRGMNGRTEFTYSSYSITDPFLNEITMDSEVDRSENDRYVKYYQKTHKLTYNIMEELTDDSNITLFFGVAAFVTFLAVLAAMINQIGALVHICKKNEGRAWKCMRHTSIWIIIAKIVGIAAVFMASGKLNKMPNTMAAKNTGLRAASAHNDIITIAPMAWITLALSIAAAVVCFMFYSKTKQPPQAKQPAVPVQPVQ